MNGKQLERLLRSDEQLSEASWGVFASNELPSTLLTGAYIVNTSPAGSPGQHWLGIWSACDGRVMFFDPLGRGLGHYNFKFPGRDVTFNRDQVQSADSSSCGLHVVYFLFWACRLLTMADILETFSRDTDMNDRMVTRFVKQMLMAYI